MEKSNSPKAPFYEEKQNAVLPLAFSLAPGLGTHALQSKQGLGSSAGILLGC